MKRLKNTTIVILILLLGLSFTDAQRRRKRYRKTPPRRGSRPIVKNDIPAIAAIIQENVVTSRKKRLEMWSAYYIYKEIPDHYYLGIPNPDSYELKLERKLGWVHKKYLIDNGSALRTKSKIYRKVIVFDNKAARRVPIYFSPSNKSEERSKTPMFSFFYIYKELKDYYLIGMAPKIDLEYSNEDLLGWIHKKSCREWNTRLSINYKIETQETRWENEKKNKNGLVKIYKTLQSAKDKEKSAVVAKESKETIWRYNMPRYPLLESRTEKERRIFQIAFLGGRQSGVTQRVVSRIKEEKEKLSMLDVMFVIDASGGAKMRERIIKAMQSIKRALAKPVKNTRVTPLNIVWGLTYYDDFKAGKKYPYRRGKLFEPRVVRIKRFTKNINKFIYNIREEHFRGGRGNKKAVFYGIDAALHRKARWRKGSTRCIIVIGGGGNHEEKSEENITKLSGPKVMLHLQRKRVRIHSIRMVETGSSNRKKNLEIFNNQMKDLIEDMEEGVQFIEPKNEQVLTKLILGLVRQYTQEINLLQEILRDLERGFTLKEIKKRHSLNWNKIWNDFKKNMGSYARVVKAPSMPNILQAFIELHGIRLTDLQGNGMFFDKGWVWERNPITNLHQVQVCLLMDQMELSRLIGFLSSLLMELKRISKPEQYVEVWKTLLKTTFGIDTIPASEPLDNLIKQHTGLPFINGLLNYTLDDFVKNSRQPKFRRQIVQKLEETCNRLFLVLEGKEIQRIKKRSGIVIAKKKKRWWKEEGNDLKYAWLEIEIFP